MTVILAGEKAKFSMVTLFVAVAGVVLELFDEVLVVVLLMFIELFEVVLVAVDFGLWLRASRVPPTAIITSATITPVRADLFMERILQSYIS